MRTRGNASLPENDAPANPQAHPLALALILFVLSAPGQVLAANTAPVLASAASSAPTFTLTWGSSGSGNGQFSNPFNLAVDGSGNIYVADQSNNRIQKFDSSGNFLLKWGSLGTGNGQFNNPYGVAVDGSGNVYVADSEANHRIQKFDSNGNYLTQWGSFGTGDGQFNVPTGVAVDGSGNVYVTEATNHRIQKFSSSGVFISKWGAFGSGNGQFSGPAGIAVDGSGNVYVADSANQRIQKFDSNGTYLTQWASGGLGYPLGVAVDASGNVYVGDNNNNRIRKFDSSGNILLSWGSGGSGNGQFSAPDGVFVDGSGNVYVAERNNPRIQKFAQAYLSTVAQNAPAPAGAVGTAVTNLVANVTDVDAGAVTGIAITAAASSNGTWYFSTNNGANWSLLGTPSGTSARLVATARGRVYFKPAANFSGTVTSALTFRAWDTTSGANGGLADASVNGTTTAFSTATDSLNQVVTAVVVPSGAVVAWGWNDSGQTNVPVAALSGVKAIAAHQDFSLALKSTGTVVAWGDNTYGQTNVPIGLSGLTAIAVGNAHSLALKSDGTVVAWGYNGSGPTNVPAGLSGVVAIAAGGYYSVALKNDGTVVTWGDNTFGQTNVPTGLSGVAAIAAGDYHTMALKNDGTVVVWGSNQSGQSTVPGGLSGVTAIAAGNSHCLALKSDGTVVAWGYNIAGQATVPVGLSGVKAIAAGVVHSVALKSDGTVVEWGSNFHGETTVPAGLSEVTAIAAGAYFTVALVPSTPIITTQPQSVAVAVGGNTTFNVLTTGTAPLAYQWRSNNVAIANATNATLTITNVQFGWNGSQYSVVVTNSFGSITSSAATLTIPTPAVTSGLLAYYPLDGNAYDYSGLGQNGTLVNSPSFASGQVGQAISLNGVNQSITLPTMDVPGNFTLASWVNLAATSSDYQVCSLFKSGQGAIALTYGVSSIVYAQVFAGSWQDLQVTYPRPTNTWFHLAMTYDSTSRNLILYSNGMEIGRRTNVNPPSGTHGGATSQIGKTYTESGFVNGRIDEVLLYNRALAPAEILLLSGGPNITAQPTNQIVAATSNATFSVTVTGTAPLAYQWRANGVNLANATNASLTLTNVQQANVNFYSVIITNAFGSVTSAVATLAIAAGWLDTTFGTGGKVITTFGSGDDYGYSVVVQSDGKVVVVGESHNGSNKDFAVVRYNTDGSLDLGFNGSGKVITAVGSGNDRATGVALQSDGKILVAGFSDVGSIPAFALVRYNANGSLDTSFNGTGKVTTSFPGTTTQDVGYAVAVQADGRIVVTGFSDGASGRVLSLARYNPDGSLDTSFGGTGKVQTLIGSGTVGNTIVIQSDGKIVVAGAATTGGSPDFALLRYNANGSLDTTFNGTGFVTTPIGAGYDAGQSVALQNDGKIVVAGLSDNGSNYDIALVRYNTNGSLDTTFNNTGKVTTSIVGGDDVGSSVLVQADGKMVVAGYSHNGSNNDFALTRYNTDGSLDLTFGTGGKLSTAVGGGNDVGNGLALLGNGGIVVAGYSYNGANYDFALVRYGGATLGPDAPVITTQPQSVAVAVGGNTTFSLLATGPLLAYQWRSNSVTIANATNSLYAISNLQSAWNGSSYSVIITNAFGSVTSAAATLTVILPAAITVTNLADSGPGTLREAVANLATNGTITFATNLSGQTLTLTSGPITLAKSLTMDASALAGGITLSGNNADRIIVVTAQTTNVLTALTLTAGLKGIGGAIHNEGTLTLNRCTLWGNNATDLGGAIFNLYASLTLNQCTLTGNTAGNNGGAINSYGVVVNLNHCTLTGNTAGTRGGGYDGSQGFNLYNSVIAGNSAPTGANLFAESVTATGVNFTNGLPLLAPLGSYGGPTKTMPPLSGSPVIDAGSDTATNSFATDQRGFPRLSGTHVDIGAVELAAAEFPAIAAAPRAPLGFTAGQNLILGAGVTGSLLNYQWRFNGAPLAGQTNALLFRPLATTNHAGNYDLIVSNYVGSVTSAVATVTINALPATRAVVAWGLNDWGQTTVPAAAQSGVTAIAARNIHTLALKNDGTVVAWGNNSYNQLNVPGGLTGVAAIAAGDAHGVALKSDGSVVAWGANNHEYGQTLVPVTAQSGVVAIAAGNAQTLALKNDGTVIAWGSNAYGQTNVPPGLTGVIAVAAGSESSVALKSDGTVIAWGDNSHLATNVPPGLTGVVAIAAADSHVLALKSDGTVVAWGQEWNGGGFSPAYVPPGLSGVAAIAPGSLHNLALKSNDTLVGWGWNDYGQSTAPTGLSGILAVAAGYEHSAVLMSGPPAIITQPQSVVLANGASVTLFAWAGGPGPLSHQWRKNGIVIPGATSSNLVLNAVNTYTNGNFDVVITNSLGSITSAVATVTVPTILISQQGSGTISKNPDASTYSPGQSVTLTATAGRYYAFKQWSDGTSTAARTITIGATNVFTAVFTNTVPLENLVLKQWDKSFGGDQSDYFWSGKPTTDGGMILLGASASPVGPYKSSPNYGDNDLWVVKLTSEGIVQWERTFGGDDREVPTAVIQLKDQGYLVAGYTASGISGNKTNAAYGGFDLWLIRLDANGNRLWDRVYGGNLNDGEDWTALVETSDGGLLVGSNSASSPGTGNKTAPRLASGSVPDLWLLKLDANGLRQWEQTYNTGGGGQVSYAHETAGYYFIAGHSGVDLYPPWSGIIDKATGALLSHQSYGVNSLLNSGVAMPDGTYWIAGYNYPGNASYILRHLDAVGNLLTVKSFGGAGNDVGYSVAATKDGGLIVGGHSDTDANGDRTVAGFGSGDIWLVKTDGSGQKLWDIAVGGTDQEGIYSSAAFELADGGIIMAGNSYSEAYPAGGKSAPQLGAGDGWVVKVVNVELPVGTPVVQVTGNYSTNHNITETNSAEVTIATSFNSGSIRYTLDGSAPTASSTLYTAPFTVSNPTTTTTTRTVRAIAYSANGQTNALADPVTITFVARPILLAQQGSGTVTANPPQTSYALGQSVTLTATAGRYYAFKQWSDGTLNSQRTIAINSSNSYTAIFTNTVPLETLVLKQWEKVFGGTDGDGVSSAARTSDGGYIFGASSQSGVSGNKTTTNYQGSDFWLIKTDADGNKQWEQNYGGSSHEVFRYDTLRQTSDGGYIFGGDSYSGISGNKTTPNYGADDAWIIKTDALGNKQWEQNFGGTNFDSLFSLQQTSDGGYILAVQAGVGTGGNKNLVGFGGYDYWLIRLDAGGNKLWDVIYGGAGDDVPWSIQQTPDGGFIVGGYSNSGISGNKTVPGFGGYDYWVLKLDANGNKQWEQTYGGTGADYFFLLRPTADGGYILSGASDSGSSGNKTAPNYGNTDYWIVKIDANGNKQWDQSLGGSGPDGWINGYGPAVDQTLDGGFIIAGTSSSGVSGNKSLPSFGTNDIWVVKLDANGNKRGEQVFGGSDRDGTQAVNATGDGGFIIGGGSESGISGNKTLPGFGGGDAWLVKAFPREAPVGMPIILANGLFSPTGSFVFPNTNAVRVTLTSSFPNAHIYYTLDGTPAADSFTEYNPGSTGLLISQTTTVRAIAFNEDYTLLSDEADPVVIQMLPVYTFTASTPGGGSVTITPPAGYSTAGPFLSNTVVSVSATASNGWTFLGWTGDVPGGAAATNNPLAVTMNANKAVQAIFGTTLSSSVTGSGAVLFSPTNNYYAYGAVVKLTALPASRKFLSAWGGVLTGSGSNNPVNFTVTVPATNVTATFGNLIPGQFALTVVETNGWGTVSVSPFTNRYVSGASVVLTATALPGYAFASWTENGVSSLFGVSQRTVLMTTDKIIYANFTPNEAPAVVITAPADGATLVGPANIPITIAASDSDGTVSSVKVYNGVTLLGTATGNPYSLTWTNVAAGSYTLTAQATDNLGAVGISAPINISVGTAPTIAVQPRSQSVTEGANPVFSVVANGTPPLSYQWRHAGTNLSGATNFAVFHQLVLTNAAGNYDVVVSSPFGSVTSSVANLTVKARPASAALVAWGFFAPENEYMPPADYVALARGFWGHTIFLLGDGTLTRHSYDNQRGNLNFPDGITNIAAVAAGEEHSLALRGDGTVIAWGLNGFGQTNVPVGLSNVVAIAAGPRHSLALRADGTVSAWGNNENGRLNVPANLSGVVAVAGGSSYSLTLKADGTLLGWGEGLPAQTALATNLVAIAANAYHFLGLRADGTVAGFLFNGGSSYYGEAIPPVGLTNVVALASGDYFDLALKTDGTVVGWGMGANGEMAPLGVSGQASPPVGLTNVFALAAGGGGGFALMSGPPVLVPIDGYPGGANLDLLPQVVSAGGRAQFQLRAAGSEPMYWRWQFNGVDIPGATNSGTLGFNPSLVPNITVSNVSGANIGNYRVIVSNAFGSVTSATAALTLNTGLPGSVDTNFVPTTTGDYQVVAMAQQPDGKLILVGNLSSSTSGKTNIVRLNASGSVDSSFNLLTILSDTSYPNDLYCVVLQPDGKMVIGGVFTNVGGFPRRNIARLNADGSVDTSFNPGTGFSPGTGSAYGDVAALALQPDGKIIAVGDFTNYNGTVRTGIARLNTDGSVDTGFVSDAGGISPIRPGAVTLQPDGKILIGGRFLSYNGAIRSWIARINNDGTVDGTFTTAGSVNYLNNNVHSIAVQPDGKIVIGGEFTTVNNISRNYVARLNADGSLDTGFNPGTGANGIVYHVALQPDGKILVGGLNMTKFNGVTREGFARLNYDGSLDTSFDMGSSSVYVPLSSSLAADGKIYIGGSISTVSGHLRYGVARLNGASTAGPGSLQFTASAYSVGESAGSLTVTVVRLDGATGPVSVHYATSNGSAIAGQDYTATNGTLNFANGETLKSITIPILNDALVEGPETVNLTLSNFIVAGAGSPISAVLTIVDDEINVPPTVTLTAPANNATFTAPASIALTTTTNDVDGNVVRMDFYTNGVLLATLNSGPFNYTWSGVVAGSYTVYAQATDNAGGVGYSTTNSVTVNEPQLPPSITAQPQNKSANIGGSATFSVTASGYSPLRYQWRFNNAPVANATNSSLSLTNIAEINGGNYSVVVTNTVGTVTSDPATLTVRPAGTPVIYVNGQPVSGTNTVGGTAAITITTELVEKTIYYTLNNSDPISNVAGRIAYPNTPGYSVNVTSNVIVRAVAYDAGNPLASDPVTVIVLPMYPLTITTPGGGSVVLTPAGGSYISNTVVTATLTASNNWSFLNWTGDATGTNATFNFTMNAAKQAQAIFGTALSTSVLGGAGAANSYVVRKPSLALYPFGSMVRLTAVPQGGYYLLNWGGAGVGHSENPLDFTVTTGAATVSAVFTPLPTDQITLSVLENGAGTAVANPQLATYTSGQAVTLTATPDAGNVFTGWTGETNSASNPLTLTLVGSKVNKTITANFIPNAAPVVALTNPVNNAVFIVGSNLTLNATASDSDGTVGQVEFFANNVSLGVDTGTPYSVVWGNAAIGSYTLTARATDNYGTMSTSAPVAIMINALAPTITGQPTPVALLAGGNATFTVAAGGTAPLSYQWRLNGVNVSAGNVTGTNAATLTINNAQLANAGLYSVVVTNAGGSVTSSSAELRVITLDNIREDFWVTDGPVRSLALTNGVLYAGGQFQNVAPVAGGAVLTDATTGVPQSGFARVDGQVYAVVSDGSGGWFIGGTFANVGGLPRANLARIRADGKVEAGFAPGVNGGVQALALLNGRLYVGGNFTGIGNNIRSRLGAVDAVSGAVLNWNPGGNGGVNALAVSGDAVYAGGDFTQVGGVNRLRLAKISTNDAGGLVTSWQVDVLSTVNALLVSGGQVYVGGDFRQIGAVFQDRLARVSEATAAVDNWVVSVNGPVRALALSGTSLLVGGSFQNLGLDSRPYLAAVSTVNAAVSAWTPNPNSPVWSLATSGNTVYAGGDFTVIDGQPRSGAAALTLDVTSGYVQAWDPKTGGRANVGGATTVRALGQQGGPVFVGGAFAVAGKVARTNLAAFNAVSGAVVAGWNPGANNSVEALAVNGGALHLGGSFTQVGASNHSYAAAVDLVSGAVLPWKPNPNGAVLAYAPRGSTLFAGGSFSTIGGVAHNRLVELNASGIGTATAWPTTVTGANVNALALSGDTLYAGGSFTQVNGTARTNLAAVAASTGALVNWDSKPNGEVFSLAVDGGVVYAGGLFTQLGGQPRAKVGAVGTNGLATTWSPGASGSGAYVKTLAVDNRTVYAGGRFNPLERQVRVNFALLDDGSGDALSADAPANDTVQSLLVSGGTAYVGGDFTTLGGRAMLYLGVVGPLGSPVFLGQVDERVANQGTALTLTARVLGQGPLFYQWRHAGTNLAGATGASLALVNVATNQSGAYSLVVSNQLGAITNLVADLTVATVPGLASTPGDVLQPPGQDVVLTINATGSEPLTYEWRLNGLEIGTNVANIGVVSLGGVSTLTITNAQATNSGSYLVTVRNPYGAADSGIVRVLVNGNANVVTLPDNFASRLTLSGANGYVVGHNVGATLETGEPQHAGRPGGASVWAKWVAPNTGVATFTTAGSSMDTLLAVYTTNATGGATVGNLRRVVYDDDAGGFGTSRVSFNTTNGVEYSIAMDGFGGATNNLVLSWKLEVVDEDVPVIVDQPRSTTATDDATTVTFTVGAVNRAGDTNNITYQWRYHGHDIANATNASLTLPVARKSDIGSYVCDVFIGGRKDRTYPAVLEFGPEAGVQSKDKFSDLAVNTVAPPAPIFGGAIRRPAAATGAAVITVSAGTFGTQILNNLGATRELQEVPLGGTGNGASRWFALKADTTGVMIVDTDGSAIDTVMTIYLGPVGATSILQLTPLITDHNSAPDGTNALVNFNTVASQVYYVAVDSETPVGSGGALTGQIQLHWRMGEGVAISQHPVSAAVLVGSNATFNVTASGVPAPAYQWRRNGVLLPGATNAVLTLTNVAFGDAGTFYSVIVSNLINVSVSGAAQLVVTEPVQFIARPVFQGGQLNLSLVVPAHIAPLTQPFYLDATTNLLQWQTIQTNLSPNGVGVFSDPDAHLFPRRFYRGRITP